MTVEQMTKMFINNKTEDTDKINRYFEELNFRHVDLNDWNASKTVWKEVAGRLILDDFLRHYTWNTDTTTQKQGVDFTFNNKNTDLKSLVGWYHDENGLNITLELKQYDKETLTEDKLTDVLAYTVLDENKISLVLIPYKKLLKQLPTLSNKYEHRVSNNGSGEYIKVPVNRIKGVMTLERLYY